MKPHHHECLHEYDSDAFVVEKKKEGADKQKYLAVEALGLAFIRHGSDLAEDSLYGILLVFAIGWLMT
jgi:hypothetical protein